MTAPIILASSVSAVLAAAYLIAAPPAGDLAAAAYRAHLFSTAGLLLWDNGWYGGHYLLGYSVLSPALDSLVGVRSALALCTLLATVLFTSLAVGTFGRQAGTAAAIWFAVGLGGEMVSGRAPYELGIVFAVASLLALQRRHLPVALMLALATGLASPVAAAFLALAGLAGGLWGLRGRESAAVGAGTGGRAATATGWTVLALCALAPPLALAVAFPEGGYEPFAPSAFWPALAGVVAVGSITPRRWRSLRLGMVIYAAALCLAYAVHTPVGGNAARLGALMAGPVLAGVLWDNHRRLLVLAVPLLAYWTLATPVRDLIAIDGQRSLSASYYAPLADELHKLTGGAPTRVEIPMLRTHAEAQYMPAGGGLDGTHGIELARGWERQLDTRYARLFYGGQPAAGVYRAWLQDNAVAYVALPDASLDGAGSAEAALIGGGLDYLREIWHSVHWRLYAVAPSPQLADDGARLLAWGPEGFTVAVPAAGDYEVRVHFTPYWGLSGSAGCVSQAPGGWTAIQAHRGGVVNVGIAFSLLRVFSHGPRCDRVA